LLEQTAEILFAGDVPCSFFGGEARQGFVFHFEAFQPHNANEFLALFPNLTLQQLHANTLHLQLIEHDVSFARLHRRVYDWHCPLVWLPWAPCL
jgi:hypothetical protein